MIRAFISTWGLVDNKLTTPILLKFNEMNQEAFDNNLPIKKITCSMHWPDSDRDGIPNKNRVLTLVESPDDIQFFRQLIGVKMLPAYRFQKPISEIPSTIKQNIKDILVIEGIPLTTLIGIKTYGDFLKQIARYFNINHTGFGFLEILKEADFA